MQCTASIHGALATDLGAMAIAGDAFAHEDGMMEDEKRLMGRIRQYIDRHLGECELDEKAIRDHFSVSRATLYRRFQRLGGVASYIRERRLQLAHQHLRRNPSCSLTWLLYEVGFASERQFQRCFHTRFGMTAADWRRSCRSN